MEENKLSVAQKMNLSVYNVLTSTQVIGFEKAFLVSSAIEELKGLLTSEYMKPIMAMQGNRLGFKTDRDKEGGYPEAVVKNCLIEAVLMGLQPTGNQFNIIAANTYATKEGVGELLKKIEGLSYKLTFELPRINTEKTSAAVKINVAWEIDGKKFKETIDMPIKMNSMMGTDAVIGKATRKARKWLYDTVTGSEIPEGDVYDVEVISTRIINKPTGEEKQAERIASMIEDATTVQDLEAIKANVRPEQQDLFNQKYNELDGKAA